MTTPQRDEQQDQDQGGQVVPFPGTRHDLAVPESGAALEPAGEVLDGEIVDEPPRPVLVTPPAAPAPMPWTGQLTRRPVLPPWLADPQTRREVARQVSGYGWHATKYHTVRVPVYGLLVVVYAPRGLWLLLGRTWVWVSDAETRPLRSSAVRRDNLDDYLKAARLTADRVRGRRIALAGELLALVAAAVAVGPGWRAEVDLPLGVTAEQIIDKRRELASGLRRPLSCVWPEPIDAEHPGRLEIWVAKQDPAKSGPVRWALASTGTYDYFARAPFGQDQRGRPVTAPLYQHNWLIGSLPGQGKTGVVRVLACAAALDPTVELWIQELKGSGDLDPLETLSHRYVSGIDDESIEYAAESLALLRAEVMRRTGALKTLPRDLCPDKRVTREITDKRSLKLWPLVCVIDECQNLFAHPDFGDQAGKDAEFIIKIGRAFGVTLILATQRPDQKSLPTGVSGNVSIRFCLKVAGQVENDMILGTSAYKNGLRATTLRAGIDAGIGYLIGATPEPTVVRVAYLDQPATERVAVRARARRDTAGTLTGHALGEQPERAPTHDVLDDLATVYATAERTDQPGVWSQLLCDRLAELRPDVYRGWGPEQLTIALKPYGLETGQLNQTGDDGQRHNWRGVRGEHLRAALAARAERRGIDP